MGLFPEDQERAILAALQAPHAAPPHTSCNTAELHHKNRTSINYGWRGKNLPLKFKTKSPENVEANSRKRDTRCRGTDELENSPCGKAILALKAGLPLENDYAEIFPVSLLALGLFLPILFFYHPDPYELPLTKNKNRNCYMLGTVKVWIFIS